MKVKKKILAVVCVCLLMAISILGTMAYFTDQEAVTNTFTVGNVEIALDEAQINEEGKPVDSSGTVVADPNSAERVSGNSYHLIPGHTYTKDPTVTVVKDSEDCYIRALVTVTYNAAADDVLVNHAVEGWYDINPELWKVTANSPSTQKTEADDENPATITRTYEFRYKDGNVVERTDKDCKLEPVFTRIYVPGEITNDELATLANLKIDVVAHAIQADGFETADEAWAAFDQQHPGL